MLARALPSIKACYLPIDLGCKFAASTHSLATGFLIVSVLDVEMLEVANREMEISEGLIKRVEERGSTRPDSNLGKAPYG